MTTETRRVLVCDNDGCGKEQILSKDLDPDYQPSGIYIKGGTIMRENGYTIMKSVFACSNDCLGPAIDHIFSKDN